MLPLFRIYSTLTNATPRWMKRERSFAICMALARAGWKTQKWIGFWLIAVTRF
jgi:hypothetical protein